MSSAQRSQPLRLPRLPFTTPVGHGHSHATDRPQQQHSYRGSLVHPRPQYARNAQKAHHLIQSSPKNLPSPKSSRSGSPRRDITTSGLTQISRSNGLHRSGAVSRGKEQPRRQHRRRAPIPSSSRAAVRSPRSPLPPRVPSTFQLKPSAKYSGYYEDDAPNASPGLYYNPSDYVKFQCQSSRPARDSINVLPRYHGTGGGNLSTHKSTSTSKHTTDLTNHRNEKQHTTMSSDRMTTIPLSPLRRMAPPARPHQLPPCGSQQDEYRYGYLWYMKYNSKTGRAELAARPAPRPEPRAQPTGLKSWLRSCVGRHY